MNVETEHQDRRLWARRAAHFGGLPFCTWLSIFQIVPNIRDGKQTGVIALPRKVSLSQHLRNGRLARRLSVADVASQVGVTAPCVYFWEMGRTRPRAENLKTLCKVLKLPVRATREIAAA
jgi:DNA-binding XRE family transcriptional regulator